MFFPRGGSAYVARSLAFGLGRLGWQVTLVAGSDTSSELGDAGLFYAGLDVRPVDYAPALASLAAGGSVRPAGSAPMHGSFEDRPGAPDRVFASLDDGEFEQLVNAWAVELEDARATTADLLYLHHLTPINEAAARVAPAVPIVGHLHGTEMLMLETIEAGAPASWTYAARWAKRMREWAAACAYLVVAPGGTARVQSLLDVSSARIVELANGFDPSLFRRLPVARTEVWRRHLVQAPRGWRPGERPGSVAYDDRAIEGLAGKPVLVAVGRFTAIKRLTLLVEAYVRARPQFDVRAPLVLIGGYPGEWEGEHPIQTIERLGAQDVFLVGWHDQAELPELLSAADVLVMPSARESFGQVIVEAMACGLAPIAARSLGPETIIEDGETGWLVAADDGDALCAAMIDAVNHPVERSRRADAAHAAALQRYAWSAVTRRLDRALLTMLASGQASNPAVVS
jgi:glycosyltransferase involved in cell wall biosynthesis